MLEKPLFVNAIESLGWASGSSKMKRELSNLPPSEELWALIRGSSTTWIAITSVRAIIVKSAGTYTIPLVNGEQMFVHKGILTSYLRIGQPTQKTLNDMYFGKNSNTPNVFEFPIEKASKINQMVRDWTSRLALRSARP